jgi:hypothetical protein
MNRWLALIAIAALLVFAAGCSEDECPTCPPDNAAPTQAYVGSATCGNAGCHQDKYNTFIESGHPYKLTEVLGDQGPTYPFDNEHTSGGIVSRDGPAPDPSTPWTDYAYVIGGYGWKARWVKPDGKIYTATAKAQLNLWGTGAEWVEYHLGEDRSYDYACFKCHTTGASEEGSWPAGTTGFGTFAFGGVQCEECHGQGAQHASDPKRFAMTVDRNATLCGRCHTRDPQNRVEVSVPSPPDPAKKYIRHHEQYDEMVHSPHAAVGCNACHDPHASTVYDAVAAGTGVIADCADCHQVQAANRAHNSVPECVDCHMPKAAKSARFDPDNPYVADVRSHTFMIDPTQIDKSAMWTSDGEFMKQDEFGRGRITLDFACYSCHKDDPTNPTNPGAPYTYKTPTQLINRATGMHTPPPAGGMASQ